MADSEAEDYIEWTEDVEISWIEMLGEFDQKVWPVFERMGYKKDTALILYAIVQLKSAVNEIRDHFCEDDT